MKQIAVIGSGIIGTSWAVVFARAGLQVRLYDGDAMQRERAVAVLRETVRASAALLREGDSVEAVLARVQVVDALDAALDGADYVQEAISEQLDAKRALFAAMDARLAPAVILASSSSTYGVSLFVEDLPGRARCLVVHPMTPPHLMPVVEVAPAPWTSAVVTQQAFAFMQALGQVPVHIHKEISGFVLNRLQGALLAEMFQVIADGVISARDADLLLSQGLGLRWATVGPLEGVDLNAPGGIADYLQRYGHIFNGMAAEKGLPAPVDEALAARLDAEMRASLALDGLARKRSWRDLAVVQVRQAMQPLYGEKP
ncbi:3-hydroxyacyl-CoA dehydrogenase [Kerstersia similis]|uniref:3-hydroxyacyl-CoA dehydrogenase n=1 Tax=Kerstersia similis TaxID=206505 RepID=UPI0039EE7179